MDRDRGLVIAGYIGTVLLICFSITSGLLQYNNAQAQQGTRYLFWSGDQEFTTFGPGQEINIFSGAMQYTTNCEDPEHDDFIYPYTDIYIVPAGSVGIGSALTDVSGTPNTVQGTNEGAFALETIGFTDSIGTGVYSVVYDECQDGKVGPEDAIFDPAFQVEFPVDVPPIDSRSIGSIKADANEQAEKWEYEKWGFQNMVWMYDAFSKFEALEDPLEGFLWIVKDIGVQGSYPEPQAAALSHLENLAKHFKGIAAEPTRHEF